MFAKNRCRVASFSLRCLRLSKRFCKKKNTEQMHPEVGVYLQTEDWNDDDAHPNYVEMSTRRTLRLILQVFELCVHLHGLIVFDIFFINPNSRPLLTFLPFPHGTRRRILAWGPTPPVPSRDARRRPCTAELLQGAKRTSVRITRTRFSP